MATASLETLDASCGDPAPASGTSLFFPSSIGDPSNQTPRVISTMVENGSAPASEPAIVAPSASVGACPWWLILLALVGGFFFTRES
jgi:hypothetical protein